MEKENISNVQAGEQEQKQNLDAAKDNNKEITTFTEEEFNKKLQSETDKVRTEYSKKIKVLENELEGLKPKQKTESEIVLEKRLKALEDKEKVMQEKELQLKISNTLNDNGLPSQLSKYLNVQGVEDVESYLGEVKDILSKHLSNNALNSSFKPVGHKESKDSINPQEFKKMNYMERMKLYTSNKELYKKLSSK